MNTLLIVVVSILIVSCHGQEGDKRKGGKGGERHKKMQEMMKKKCAEPRTDESKAKMDKMHEEKQKCMKEQFVDYEKIEKACWTEAFGDKPPPAKGSEMFEMMCKGMDDEAEQKSMGKMMHCTMGKMAEAEKAKDPEMDRKKMWDKMKKCHPRDEKKE